MAIPDVYQAFWRHKLLILGLTAVFGVGAYVLTKREQPVYTATSLVRVQQRVDNAGEAFGALQTTGRLAQTYAKIAATTTIARRIYVDLDSQVPLPAIDTHVSGEQIEDLDLLKINATGSDPKIAQIVANTAPVALQDFVKSTGTLRDEVILVQRASIPTAPTSPSLKLNVVIAVVLGLILNAALALLLDAIRDRAVDAEEVERLAGVPVLSIVPAVDRRPVRTLLGRRSSRYVRDEKKKALRHD